MSFVHLNTHSHYSLLDAFGTPKDIVKKAKEQGSPAVGLTDNGYLYGAVEFYKAAKDAGIKAIIGCEFYLTSGSRFEKTLQTEESLSRLTLLAFDKEGYHNLLHLSTLASLEGYYSKPRIDWDLVQKHSSGLIALSGSKWGELPQAILENDQQLQEKILERYLQLFKQNYYLEIQRHPEIQEYHSIEKRLIELSRKHNIPLVATQNPHYIKSEYADTHDILLCIGNQTNILDTSRQKYLGDFSMKTPEQMLELFHDLPEACENTLKIAEKCDVKLDFGQYLIPKFKTPNQETSEQYLRILCEKGLRELYPPDQHERAQKQLDYELGVVNSMGFNDYFLIVWDFIDYAKKQGITVGPGRGSAAGAIIAYTLKITELDPMEHGLIFERFLNPDRVSMPDIDIDFADHRRHEVLEYTINKYGKDCVSQVITYGTMSAKAAVRDVGRGMGYPYSEVDQIAKAVPQPVLGKHAPLNISVKKDPNLSELYENNTRARALLDNAIKIEGTVRNAGTHACAVIIADRPLVNFTPLQKSTDGSDGIVTQYSMKYLEDIGLLKMDFLGLKNLTIMEKALELIQKRTGEKIDLLKIPMDDQKTFELLQRGDTTGVFQLESSGMRRYIKELKPNQFEDIVAMISLYRPGPMEWIPSYIEGKHKPETVKYLDPSFVNILKETNGVAIYQEQILVIARQFAGFTLGEADILRRAIGKKDPKALAEQKDKFIEGAVRCGQTKAHGKLIFEKAIEPFAGYGFNKAHAACYAMISYRTSWLKAHYPTELMAALLTSDHGNTDKIAIEMNDCEEMGIKVMPPSINESESSFSVIQEGKIRFGLSAIKGLGEGAINQIIENREKSGKFHSLEELVSRLPTKLINKKALESLAYSGALDELGDRRTIAENHETISKYAKNIEHSSKSNVDQSDLFEMYDADQTDHMKEKLKLKPLPPLSTMEKLKLEKHYLGLYVSSTPLKGLTAYLQKKAKLIGDFTEKDIDKNVKVAGILASIRTIITKSGAAMAYAEIEDSTGKIPITIFPKVFDQYKFKLKEDQILIVDGKLEHRRGELQLAVFDLKTVSLETMIKNATEAGIYDPQEKTQRRQPQIDLEKLQKKAATNTTSAQTKSPIIMENDTIRISIPDKFDQSKFVELKELLGKSPGDMKVEIQLKQNNKDKIIKTDMKISDTPELRAAIQKILG